MPIATVQRRNDAGVARGLPRRDHSSGREQPEHGPWTRVRNGLADGSLCPRGPRLARPVVGAGPKHGTIEWLVTASPAALRFTAEQWAAIRERPSNVKLEPEPSCSPGDLFRLHPERVLFDPMPPRPKRERDREIL